ncbi:MAG: hypothetical protein ACXWG1_01565 [Usitatibacter sp.]
MKEVEKKDVNEISGGQDLVVTPLPIIQGPLVNYPQIPIPDQPIDPMDPLGDRRHVQS